MRLWSLHPKYLDTKGLVALWREALLAKAVLSGLTKGYTQHPQLDRFKEDPRPLDRIDQYLSDVYLEAVERNYRFDKEKINWQFTPSKLLVTSGQLEYERTHLLAKLKIRDAVRYEKISKIEQLDPHPMFSLVEGGIASWEIISINKL
ncbi:MAG: pyrimidine dimer DNA glycosylase/endonuclease V [Candidatus Marinimicrobia bacterium]|nr:pyrimidine dimer DNA glycosylase/endonuclease V [Candidatus Neomarinimicrobiota bacterium]